jgi:acyl carrier protein
MPRNAVETAVAALWAQALGLEAIGVEDNFFDLGGDSIAAVQLTTAIQRWLDAAVPLATLFDAPTVAAMSCSLQTAFAAPLATALKRGTDREHGEL